MDSVAEKFIAFTDTPWAPVFLFIHAFMESSFLPGAHDFFLIAVNMARPHLAFFFALFSTLGSTCGGCFGYAIGRYGGKPLIEKVAHHKITRTVEKSYEKFGMWAVAFAGFTPVPYKIFAIISGIFEINFPLFAFISLLARAARFFLLSVLIFVVGDRIKDVLLGYFNIFSIVLLTFILVIVLIYKVVKRKVKHD